MGRYSGANLTVVYTINFDICCQMFMWTHEHVLLNGNKKLYQKTNKVDWSIGWISFCVLEKWIGQNRVVDQVVPVQIIDEIKNIPNNLIEMSIESWPNVRPIWNWNPMHRLRRQVATDLHPSLVRTMRIREPHQHSTLQCGISIIAIRKSVRAEN